MAPTDKFCAGPTPSLHHLPAVVPRSRFFSTLGTSVDSVPQDASASILDVPPRIKFKRLDKTARHIMEV